MNPYKSPNIESKEPESRSSDPITWANGKLEILSISFGITFLVIVISMAIYRESVPKLERSHGLFWITESHAALLIGVLGGILSCVLLIQFQYWGKWLLERR